jgi:hypothetical protein
MGMSRFVHATPVEEVSFSPNRAHSANRLAKPLPGVFPVVHTPYDYDKGIS